MLNESQAAGNSVEADRPLVILVDDDDSFREALHELMLSVGLDASASPRRATCSRPSFRIGRVPRRRRADARR